MGKVLLEKLLYSCSDVRTIYILIRTKRCKTPEVRTEEMLKLPVSMMAEGLVGLSCSSKQFPVTLPQHTPIPVAFKSSEISHFACRQT
jgi:hypothetical protein